MMSQEVTRLRSPLSRKFDEAALYACELHREQARKGTETPYIAHLFAVAAIVLEDGGTEDEAVAALLHDAVEDQGGRATEHAIRARFGDVVADIVIACSDTDSAKPVARSARCGGRKCRLQGDEST